MRRLLVRAKLLQHLITFHVPSAVRPLPSGLSARTTLLSNKVRTSSSRESYANRLAMRRLGATVVLRSACTPLAVTL
jgi:hypothetical protein